MVDFDYSFPPPVPSWTPQEYRPSHHTPGQLLYEEVSNFYTEVARRISDLHHPQEYAKTLQQISQLMRIAHCSSSGGEFLSKEAEEIARQRLSELREELDDGKSHTENIAPEVSSIIFSLTYNNPKALLVSRLTELEYKFCIHRIEEQANLSSQQAEELYSQVEGVRHVLNRAIQEIKPSLVDLKALELARQLHDLPNQENSSDAVKKTIDIWLHTMLH